MTPNASLILAVIVALPKPVPPDTSHLAPGYHGTPHGCIVSDIQRVLPTPVPPTDPRIKRDFADHPDSYDHYVAQYARQHRQYSQAIAAYRRALGETKERTYAADAIFRLPLSDVLYRAHRIPEAKLQWRTILAHPSSGSSDSATAAVLRGRFNDALVKYAMSPPPFNTVTFGDDGSAYNLQRGLNEAAKGNIPGAKTFLGYALECDSMFQVPHLALGVIAAMEHDYVTARHEWLAVLEGWDPSTMPGITPAQYDAIQLLLRYD